MKSLPYMIAMVGMSIVLGGWAHALDATDLTSDKGENFLTGVPVTFSVTVTGANDVTTYTWDFDDDSPKEVTDVPTVMHTFTDEDVYAVSVTVNNGVDSQPGFDFDFFEAVMAPDAGVPASSNTLDPKVENPDDGVIFNLDQGQGGFIGGSLSDDSAIMAEVRAGNDFTTDFGDGIDGRTGSSLLHRYTQPGIFVLDAVRSQNGSQTGEVRKTLAFSISDIKGSPMPGITEPGLTNRQIKIKNFKAKFHFDGGGKAAVRAAKSDNDTVIVSWNMTLPGGFDPNNLPSVDLAIGNVTDSVMLDKNGKGTLTQPSPYKSVRFKLPRLKKGQTAAPPGVNALVTVSMSSEGLTDQGFDTEGITPRAHQNSATGSKGPFDRKIQVATQFAGVTYTGNANVGLVVSKDDAFGTVSGRK